METDWTYRAFPRAHPMPSRAVGLVRAKQKGKCKGTNLEEKPGHQCSAKQNKSGVKSLRITESQTVLG